MSQSWHGRVQRYLNELEQLVETVHSTLEQTRIETTQINAGQVEQSTRRLEQALGGLEVKLAERETLLHDADAPIDGLTLTAKLRGTCSVDDERLARRCGEIARRIADAHHHAISLFVCQYHLSHFSTEVAQLLTGSVVASTYQPPGKAGRAAGRSNGGGLLNESA